MNTSQDNGNDQLKQMEPDQLKNMSTQLIENLIDVETPTDVKTDSPILTSVMANDGTNTSAPTNHEATIGTIDKLETQLSPLTITNNHPTPNVNQEHSSSDTSTAANSNVTNQQSNDDNIVDQTKATADSLNQIHTSNLKCDELKQELVRVKTEKSDLEEKVKSLRRDLDSCRSEIDREVQRRIDLEQRFTEEAKRTTDQIGELIVKSDRDDAKLNELRKKFDLHARETSSMIESFTTNREFLASQLIELRNENDYLLGQYLSKAQELQSADIDLPQSVDELQFHCLTLNEKLILTTMAKERLEETLAKSTTSVTGTSTSGSGSGGGNSGSLSQTSNSSMPA